jgi:arylsulfatase A-like enzyme
VLVVLMDDAGFGQPDTFGGAVSTPALSRLADDGLRYNRFTSRRCARRRVPRC